MGATYSFMDAEKKTWIEHNLMFDNDIRKANLGFLQSILDGTEMYLTYTESEWGGIKYQHWFVTDRIKFIEFGSPSLDVYTTRVTINTNARFNYTLDNNKRKKMDKQMRERILHVLGMSNYSLCLRNCEHVANYIFRGRWVSSQMDAESNFLLTHFKKYMLGPQIRMVNTFPSCIRPHVFKDDVESKLYSFIDKHYIATRFDYYLDSEEDTYNVLVVGPTGAGKSHLINVFFNQSICDSNLSHRSVTKEIYFIRGRGSVYSHKEENYVERNIVVADTIGLCDTEWDDAKIIELIKGRVSSNFKSIDAVFIVFKADRLPKEQVDNIKKVMEWLKYKKGKNSLKFQFVCTHADSVNTEKKNELREEAKEILKIGETERKIHYSGENFQSLIYTGFPPEDDLNEKTKKRVVESWENLNKLILYPNKAKSIDLKDSLCTIF